MQRNNSGILDLIQSFTSKSHLKCLHLISYITEIPFFTCADKGKKPFKFMIDINNKKCGEMLYKTSEKGNSFFMKREQEKPFKNLCTSPFVQARDETRAIKQRRQFVCMLFMASKFIYFAFLFSPVRSPH